VKLFLSRNPFHIQPCLAQQALLFSIFCSSSCPGHKKKNSRNKRQTRAESGGERSRATRLLFNSEEERERTREAENRSGFLSCYGFFVSIVPLSTLPLFLSSLSLSLSPFSTLSLSTLSSESPIMIPSDRPSSPSSPASTTPAPPRLRSPPRAPPSSLGASSSSS
jgi:hypothetical protein